MAGSRTASPHSRGSPSPAVPPTHCRVQVRLDGAGAQLAGLPQDSWLQVEGVLMPGSATLANRFVPALAISMV